MLYLAKKNKMYYLRIRIPQDVKQYFPTPEIKRSLHTQLYKQANTLTRLFVADTERVFMMIRSNTLTYPQIYKIIDKLLVKNLSIYDVDATTALNADDYEKIQQFTINKCDRIIKTTKEVLAKKKYVDVNQVKAQKILEASGIIIEKDSQEFSKFCEELSRARITQYEVIKLRINGEEHPYEQELKQRKKSNTLQEVMDGYIDRRKKISKARSLTKLPEKFSKILNCFEYETKEKEVLLSDIDYTLTLKVANRLANYPLYRNLKFAGKLLDEIYALKGVQYPSYTTCIPGLL